MTDAALRDKVAVVTGASRGIGRGTAIALAERGATVYVTGRSTGDGELTIDRTVAMVNDAGGRGIAVQTDHGDDAQIEALFQRLAVDHGHLDILVNNVYKIPNPPAWGGGFWDHPVSIWDDQVGIGLRAHYVATWHAAPLLFAAGPGGFICNVSSPGGQSYHFSSSYGAPTWRSSCNRRALPASPSIRAASPPSSSSVHEASVPKKWSRRKRLWSSAAASLRWPQRPTLCNAPDRSNGLKMSGPSLASSTSSDVPLPPTPSD
jgi:NADP-dependent 3-hydroxy acid dehydrogenase YdfG